MIRDSISKAIVVDDEVTQGLPVALALWRHGIEASYYRGREEELPEKPLTGVRLVVLDMVLEGVDPRNSKLVVSTLFGVLEKLIHTANGPYIIVTWSGHPNNVSAFHEKISEPQEWSQIFARPTIVIDLKKEDYLSSNAIASTDEKTTVESVMTSEGFKFDAFMSDLKNKLSEQRSLLLLFDWESRMRQASSNTLHELSEVSLGVSSSATLPTKHTASIEDRWRIVIDRILASLVRGEGGSHNKNWKQAVVSLSRSLTPLVQDRAERLLAHIFEECDKEKNNKACKELVDATADISAINLDDPKEMLFRNSFAPLINGLLLVDRIGGSSVYPGNVYPCEELTKSLPTWTKKEGNHSFAELVFLNTINGNMAEDVEGLAVPIVLEFTPLCDYIQGKMKMCRLVGGLIIPFDKRTAAKTDAEFIWSFGPVIRHEVETLANSSLIIANSHFMVGLKKQELCKINPLFRLRGDLLSSMQTWVGAHTARQGALMMPHKDPEAEE